MTSHHSSMSRRTLLAQLTVLATAGAFPGAAVLAKDRYRGIQKVEVFTHMDVPIKVPKNPPFELNVYRLDGYLQANKALDRLTPKGLTRAQHQEWGKNYVATHPEFERKWDGPIMETLKGMQAVRNYSTHGRIPAIVINGQWVLVWETDVDKAIDQYHQQERN